jgi:hypothetical protein
MIGAPDGFSLLGDNLKASGELRQIGRLHEQLQIHERGAKRSTPCF